MIEGSGDNVRSNIKSGHISAVCTSISKSFHAKHVTFKDVTLRLSNVHEFIVPTLRELAGLHEKYDGKVMDLSDDSVLSMLENIGTGKDPDMNGIERSHLQIYEQGIRFEYEELQVHKTNPFVHLDNLDVSCYDRDYESAAYRFEMKVKHLEAWRDAVDRAITTLTDVSAPMALAAIRTLDNMENGVLAEELPQLTKDNAALALQRLRKHLETFSNDSSNTRSAALGREHLERYLGVFDGANFDVKETEAWAKQEVDRLHNLLREGIAKTQRLLKNPTLELNDLLDDYPSMDEVYNEASKTISKARIFVEGKDILPPLGGSCIVGPAPPSRRWAMAMMSWNAPYERPAPAMYYITPPKESYSPSEVNEWMRVFSKTTLPAITVHEVIPGHFAHGQMLRTQNSDIARTLFSNSFVEGWAHYAEELMYEEGFMEEDPRFQVGVALEALVRVARVLSTIAQHANGRSVKYAATLFEEIAFLRGPAAYLEAERALFDPTYARYSLGKKEILKARDYAKSTLGTRFNLGKFHQALLHYGSPPLGLLTKITEEYTQSELFERP